MTATTLARLCRHADRAIARAEAGRSKLPSSVLELEGYSSPTVRHFLNNLCSFAAANYLEIGTWKGSTLVAAAYGNAGRFTAVDDFSHCAVESGEDGRDAREKLRRVRRRFRRQCRVTFHEADCWSWKLLDRLPRAVNVYFYDGPHSFDDQYRAFAHFEPVLARRYVAVVDDWNRPHVRQATRDALAQVGHRLVWEREMFTRGWFRQYLTGAWEGVHWFNGLFVGVLEKPRPQAPKRPA